MTIEEKRYWVQGYCEYSDDCEGCLLYGGCCVYSEDDWENCDDVTVEKAYQAIYGATDNSKKPYRTTILEKAIDTTNGSRSQDYGKPEKSFDAVAELWTGYLKAKYGAEFELTPKDVALMMVELKIGRTITGHNKEDNYVDMCGYAANAGEIEHEENNQ